MAVGQKEQHGGPRTLLLWGSRGHLQPTFPGGPKEPNSSLPPHPHPAPAPTLTSESSQELGREKVTSRAPSPESRKGWWNPGWRGAGCSPRSSAEGPADPGEGTVTHPVTLDVTFGSLDFLFCELGLVIPSNQAPGVAKAE